MRVLDIKEAAELLHVSRSMTYKLVRENKVPHFRIGAKVLFEIESLEKYVSEKVSRAFEACE